MKSLLKSVFLALILSTLTASAIAGSKQPKPQKVVKVHKKLEGTTVPVKKK